MVEVKVNPGVCGLNTIIKVNSEDCKMQITAIRKRIRNRIQ